MLQDRDETRRCFTEAARVPRREIAALPKPPSDKLALFVERGGA